jgi:hypothetical protein
MTFQGLNLIFGPSYAADAARPLHPASSVHLGSSIRGAGRDHYIGLLFSSLQLISLRITIHNTSTWTNRPGKISYKYKK